MLNSVIKIAILGDGGVGKTSLLRARKELTFIEESQITIGVDIAVIPFELNQVDQANSSFLAVDLGGQPRFHFIHDAYLKGVKSAIIVYDLTRYPSFLSIPMWYELIYHENPMIPVFIVGTKKDLVDPSLLNSYNEEFSQLKESLPNSKNIIGNYYISAKTKEGIAELFETCEKMMKYYYSMD
ncbi:MAG: GTP-binding protein [Candidatus Lokiarchaeota archaeon]|nr:GTP-binding protein [Candidatus Harpocratesius repetitus]